MVSGALHFDDEEQERIEEARVLLSAGDFHLTTGQFIHDATMHAVDEVMGTNDAVWRDRMSRRG